MSLLPYGDLDSLPEDLRRLLVGRLPANLYREMMHSPAALGAFLAFATKMSKHELGKLLREVIILRIAAHRGVKYVTHQHRLLSAAMGFSEEKIHAIEAGLTESDLLNDTERALLRFTDELTRRHRASEAAFKALAAHLSSRQMVEATMIAGQYFMVSTFLETFQVDIEEEGQISSEKYKARAAWQPAEDA